ncbi:DUF736 family protein [Sphingomonas sp. CL5.1]|uniref:DUF736 domain-containing protein n=1 Tax=Sphingomonas sp. CL5.1 TaxID=2653203 RepID=UPI00158349D0|nr:DUF736 family protein [Sphingomonas sp. CL5.1]QKR98269.1 DUF736 family protein [Sphingomonas sp. CL5.1]
MTTIGTFTQTDEDEFVGELQCFTFHRENLRIVSATDRTSDKSPTHLMMYGDSEVAQGWLNHTQDDRPYIGFRIDDPGFVAPIYPGLYARGDGHSFDLNWTRPKKRRED